MDWSAVYIKCVFCPHVWNESIIDCSCYIPPQNRHHIHSSHSGSYSTSHLQDTQNHNHILDNPRYNHTALQTQISWENIMWLDSYSVPIYWKGGVTQKILGSSPSRLWVWDPPIIFWSYSFRASFEPKRWTKQLWWPRCLSNVRKNLQL